MESIFLIHWHEAEAKGRAAKLRELGYAPTVHWSLEGSNTASLQSLSTDPPAAVVVDLGRLPSHGMAIARWLRERKATRRIPLLFVPGDEEKTQRVRAVFSDAVFAPWSRMRTALRNAIASPPADPVVPAQPDYSGTPLGKKLGIKAQSRVVLVRAPKDFAATLGALPAGAVTTTRLGGQADVVLLFCKALSELKADLPRAAKCLAERGGLWVGWPKKTSGVLTDLDQQKVRAVGLGEGLVDNKICAIDAVWSGQRFARRQKK